MNFRKNVDAKAAFKEMSDALYKEVGEKILRESRKQQEQINKKLEKSLRDWEKRVEKEGMLILKRLISEKLKRDCKCQ